MADSADAPQGNKIGRAARQTGGAPAGELDSQRKVNGALGDKVAEQVEQPWWLTYASARGDGSVDFAAVVDRYQTPLLRYVAPLVGQQPGGVADAEDVVQDTFLRLHRQVSQRGKASIEHLPSWLYRVAHNLARDAMRTKRRRGQAQQAMADAAAGDRDAGLDAIDHLGDMERREACRRAMAELYELPEHQRQVLILKITGDMTLRQIGQITGLTVGNVGYRINQGLKELSQRLKRAGVI